MSHSSATVEDLKIPKRSATPRTLTVVGTGLTAAVIVLEAKDEDDVQLFLKTSGMSSQIEITNETDTQIDAVIHFIGADTENLNVGGLYHIDAWVYKSSGDREQILERQYFHVLGIVHEPDTTPPDPPSLPPLVQSEVWRRFTHTWTADGVSDTVTIPGVGMADPTYDPKISFEDLPSGGTVSILTVPSATKTATQFVIQAAGPIKAGTVLAIHLADR